MKSNTHLFIVSRSVILRMRNVSDKIYRENQNTHFVFNNFFLFRKSCLLWDKGEKYCKAGKPHMTIWRMRIACWIPKATNTHSEYVIFIAFLQQKWLHERAWILPVLYRVIRKSLCTWRLQYKMHAKLQYLQQFQSPTMMT